MPLLVPVQKKMVVLSLIILALIIVFRCLFLKNNNTFESMSMTNNVDKDDDSRDGWQTCRTVRYVLMSVSLKDVVFDAETLDFCSKDTAYKYHLVPIRCNDNKIRIAMADINGETLLQIAIILNRDLEFVKAKPQDIEVALKRLYERKWGNQ